MNHRYIAPLLLAVFLLGCEGQPPSSDQIQGAQQERLNREATAQTGMPGITNFTERKLLKDILELRDQAGFQTYTFLENMVPTVVKGHTALGGKLTFFCDSIGYGIPYATQYTNPQKVEYINHTGQVGYSYQVIPQADPNGLYSPSSAEGTWVMCADPSSKGQAKPQYVEPKIVTLTYKPPFD